MNFAGCIMPESGLFHLMSASAPIGTSVVKRNFGWKNTTNSLFSIALFMVSVIFFLSSLSSFISFVYSMTRCVAKFSFPNLRAMFALSIIEVMSAVGSAM